MQERIYPLVKGVDVAARFDGVTIPFQVPSRFEEILTVCGGSEEVAVSIFNKAYALDLQKAVKGEAGDDSPESTVETLREVARTFKPGATRVRNPNGAAAKTAGARKQATDLVTETAAVITDEQIQMARSLPNGEILAAQMQKMKDSADALRKASEEQAAARAAKKTAAPAAGTSPNGVTEAMRAEAAAEVTQVPEAPKTGRRPAAR